MKQLIKNILNDISKTQVNLESEAAQDMITNLIMAGIKSKGWYLNLGKAHHDDNLDTAGYPVKKIDKWLTRDIDEVQMIDEYKDIVENLDKSDMEKKMTWEDSIKEEQEARDTWVCGICNESTYDVDWDYVGSGTNHLECELEIEMKDDKDTDYIFESPDGGETIYKRKFGEDKRELYKVKDDS